MSGGEVRTVELARACRPEALARIGAAPQVEIDHLGSVDGGEPHDLAGASFEREAGPHGDDGVEHAHSIG